MIAPIYLLVTIAGLYKRKEMGMDVTDDLFRFETINYATGIFYSIRYSFLHSQIGVVLLKTLIFGWHFIFCRKKDTRTYFNISDKFFRNTIFSGIILFLAIQGIFQIFLCLIGKLFKGTQGFLKIQF